MEDGNDGLPDGMEDGNDGPPDGMEAGDDGPPDGMEDDGDGLLNGGERREEELVDGRPDGELLLDEDGEGNEGGDGDDGGARFNVLQDCISSTAANKRVNRAKPEGRVIDFIAGSWVAECTMLICP